MNAHHDEWGIWPNHPSEQRNSPADSLFQYRRCLKENLKDFQGSLWLHNALRTQRCWRGTHDRAPSSSGQSVAPAHSVARRALVGQRDDLRCLRYPAARAPVGVSSSRRAVCARCYGRSLHGPKVRPKTKPACATTVVGCIMNIFS